MIRDRWEGIVRPYTDEQVKKLRGSYQIEYTLAKLGAEKFWKMLSEESPVCALGCLAANQGVQVVKAGCKAIYLSGWQVASENDLGMYPDQSLYPSNLAPKLVERINNALLRADQIESVEGKVSRDWLVPIIMDGEAGFGGDLNVYEITQQAIKKGASSCHFEDQLTSLKKCGHLGSKVLVPVSEFVRKLIAARLSSDVAGVSTVIIARTDANSAQYLTSDFDEDDKQFITGERTSEGLFKITGGLEMAIARGLSYCPYADLIWAETSTPSIKDAERFANKIHEKYPNKLLAYNLSPSFNWKKYLSDTEISTFIPDLASMGYAYQFITLAGFHTLNFSSFSLAEDFMKRGMLAYSELQQQEIAKETSGYTATKHQREVGTGFFDEISQVITSGKSSTTALKGSTEEHQF